MRQNVSELSGQLEYDGVAPGPEEGGTTKRSWLGIALCFVSATLMIGLAAAFVRYLVILP